MAMSYKEFLITLLSVAAFFSRFGDATVLTIDKDLTIGATSADIVFQDPLDAELSVFNELGSDAMEANVFLYDRTCEHMIFGPDVVELTELEKFGNTFQYILSIDKSLIDISEHTRLFRNLRNSHWKSESNVPKGQIEFCTKVVTSYKEDGSGDPVPSTYRTTKFEVKFDTPSASTVEKNDGFFGEIEFQLTHVTVIDDDCKFCRLVRPLNNFFLTASHEQR